MEKQLLTKIGVVVEKIAEICDLAAPGVQVIDGPEIGEMEDDALLIGMPDGERAGYSSRVSMQSGRGGGRKREDWSVQLMLGLFTGTDDVASLRTKAVGILGEIDAALTVAQVVEGVWDKAGIAGEILWVPYQTPDGASLVVTFTVEGSALL